MENGIVENRVVFQKYLVENNYISCQPNLYKSKSWNIAFIVATLLLSHIIHLFFIFSFLFLNFSSPNYIYIYIIKNKKLFFSLLVHTYYYTSCNFSPPFLSFYLPTILGFIVTTPSSFYLSYILTLLLHILFCINLMSFLPFNPDFQHNHSLSLSLGWFSLFFNMCFGIVCVCVCVCVCVFSISHKKSFIFPFYNFDWILVLVNT